MARRYDPKFRFVLTDRKSGQFPKIDRTLISEKKLTDSLDQTYIFDDRDNPDYKVGYYNALYKGVAEFEVFTF